MKTTPKKTRTIVTKDLKSSDIHLKKDENLTYIAVLKDGFKKPKTLTFHFDGENSKLTFLTFIIGKNKEEFPLETISNHKVPNTSSAFYIRSTLFDNSSVNFQGNIKIQEKAKKTNANLSHHTLMLSNNVKAKTIPSLEIKANDVKAAHSATIGKVNKELLFYLQSRGINKKLGEKLLIRSFLESDLKKIYDEKTRLKVAQELENSLPTL